MAKKCVYCSVELNSESAIDVCERCGYKVWGERMFRNIVSEMENAKEKGNLNQGFVGTPLDRETYKKTTF
jgi:RimJ/RimL family protein N-acetyltransferase